MHSDCKILAGKSFSRILSLRYADRTVITPPESYATTNECNFSTTLPSYVPTFTWHDSTRPSFGISNISFCMFYLKIYLSALAFLQLHHHIVSRYTYIAHFGFVFFLSCQICSWGYFWWQNCLNAQLGTSLLVQRRTVILEPEEQLAFNTGHVNECLRLWEI